jgi:hypothetical protein
MSDARGPTNKPPARPPPLPPRALTAAAQRLPPMRAPLPSSEGVMTAEAKVSLADIALQLRDEQLSARIVHYKADLETNQELDAVTAQVVAELQHLQQTAKPPSIAPPPPDRTALEAELTQNLALLLARLFRADKLSPAIERKLAEIGKAFARLFFASELAQKIRGASGVETTKSISFVEQALFHALSKMEPHLVAELDAFDYYDPEVRDAAKARLADMIKDVRNGYLSRTTPELNELVTLLNDVLVRFFTVELPPFIGELSFDIVKQARLADSRLRTGYKIASDAFPRFRQTFERRFLHRLVGFAEDEMLARVRDRQDAFRVDTIYFVADPQIFVDVCECVCDAVYDFLYSDGFLDLPPDWRARLAAKP